MSTRPRLDGTQRCPLAHNGRRSATPWHTVYQQTQRWTNAGVFEAIVHDLRSLLRLAAVKAPQPSVIVIDSRTLQSTPESGASAGYDGAKRRKGSKTHIAVDTLGHLLALIISPANEGDRERVGDVVEAVQQATEESVQVSYVDQGYTGQAAAEEVAGYGMRLEVVKLPEAKRGFVLLPRRWVVERSFGWAGRFRRLARDNERLPQSYSRRPSK